ncbi:MAG: gamma-glutamyltransferase [Panacagrimonas sp.]
MSERAWVVRWAVMLLLAGFAQLSTAQNAAAKPGAHAIASAHPLATEAGLEILAAGGNAFDAAIAVSSTIAVVEPTGSGIGGGGFWLLHRAADRFETFIDGRETAPRAAHERMFLGADGKVNAAASRDGALAAGIPGEPAALDHLARTYGRLPLARSLGPAIRAAREGFACDDKLARAFEQFWKRLDAEAQRVFAVQARAPRVGERIVQPDLARTLERLAATGSRGFYEGETAQALLAGVAAAGGVWSADDLRHYRVVERRPVITWFRDVRIVSAPPPSAGGITLGQTLGQLEALGWRGGAGADSKHLVIESLRRAYRDRAAWLGDPDFVRIPSQRLLSRTYTRGLLSDLHADRATPSAELAPAQPSPQGTQTSHFSVLDAEGNRVAGTLSINLSFGAGLIPPGTGVLLNDEMDDFAASETASNAYGLIGSHANRVQPGKRPLSSMTPTFAEGPHGLLIVGTPGGSRIISMVLLGLLAWAEGADAQAVVSLPRFHHQYLPDQVQFEPGAFSPEIQSALAAKGHVLKALTSDYGNMHVVTWDPRSNRVQAASDPRGVGVGRVVRVQ